MTPAGMERHGRIEPTEPTPWRCKKPVSPAWLGVLLGALNVLVIAIGMGVSVPHWNGLGVAFTVFMMGILPGVVAGACLGALAGSLRAEPRWRRVSVLLIRALAVVGALAWGVGLLSFAAVSAIPTAVAVLVLERWTRERVEPVVPAARAR